jgi:hypothetical protein
MKILKGKNPEELTFSTPPVMTGDNLSPSPPGEGFRVRRLREMGRWGDGEMRRWGDGEMGRWGDEKMGRWGDGEMGRWGDEEMGR